MKKGILASNIGALPILQECPSRDINVECDWLKYKCLYCKMIGEEGSSINSVQRLAEGF